MKRRSDSGVFGMFQKHHAEQLMYVKSELIVEEALEIVESDVLGL